MTRIRSFACKLIRTGTHALLEQLFENDLGTLEFGRIDIRDIVGNDPLPHLRRIQGVLQSAEFRAIQQIH